LNVKDFQKKIRVFKGYRNLMTNKLSTSLSYKECIMFLYVDLTEYITNFKANTKVFF